ncbi:MAG: glycoside hydrolase family 130 protein [Fimbriimonadaceae bacterium]|jgi:predicted GH43/DUF377 family glycosyl hydrolase|nr:glycoside hydrolase family 130 protein [Fimbriimonadaceae bacterium]
MKPWMLGPFVKHVSAGAILQPETESVFHCQVRNTSTAWESSSVFNPSALAYEGKIHLIYRAEDGSGEGYGLHTSRIGLAISENGIDFKRQGEPILFPDQDDFLGEEWPGGCEDPRVVRAEEGFWVMHYTRWDQLVARLGVATSNDLRTWQKHPLALQGEHGKRWAKSAAVVCRREGDELIAAKVEGRYTLYFGESNLFVAQSDDLIQWEVIEEKPGHPKSVMTTRPGRWDSGLVEPGPTALLTEDGILLLYNAKNSEDFGDPTLPGGCYCTGQALFSSSDPTLLIDRSEDFFLRPEEPYELGGQFTSGCVFIEGLVPFGDSWWLYYGCSDSQIAVASCPRAGSPSHIS